MRDGQVLLIDGAAGGVGSVAVFEEGRFRIPVRQTFALAETAQAHELAAQGPRQGKIVLTVN